MRWMAQTSMVAPDASALTAAAPLEVVHADSTTPMPMPTGVASAKVAMTDQNCTTG